METGTMPRNQPTPATRSRPFAAIAAKWQGWEEIGASPWAVRQLRYGLNLPWVSPPKAHRAPPYPAERGKREFITIEVIRWKKLGYVREVGREEPRSWNHVSSAFVVVA